MGKKAKKARKLKKEKHSTLKQWIHPSIFTILKIVSIEDLAKLVKEINSEE